MVDSVQKFVVSPVDHLVWGLRPMEYDPSDSSGELDSSLLNCVGNFLSCAVFLIFWRYIWINFYWEFWILSCLVCGVGRISVDWLSCVRLLKIRVLILYCGELGEGLEFLNFSRESLVLLFVYVCLPAFSVSQVEVTQNLWWIRAFPSGYFLWLSMFFLAAKKVGTWYSKLERQGMLTCLVM